jgi:hypothetical protein
LGPDRRDDPGRRPKTRAGYLSLACRVAGVSCEEIDLGEARELARVLAWSGRLPAEADWLPSARAAADRSQLEALF